MHKTTIPCQFGLFCHQLTTISPSILNHFWWELYQHSPPLVTAFITVFVDLKFFVSGCLLLPEATFGCAVKLRSFILAYKVKDVSLLLYLNSVLVEAMFIVCRILKTELQDPVPCQCTVQLCCMQVWQPFAQVMNNLLILIPFVAK